MPTLTDVLRDQTALAPEQAEWLHLLVGDWQLLSDLSFADLVLWVPAEPDGWLAVAHVRPTTGAMVFFDDLVGPADRPGPPAAAGPGVRRRAHRPRRATRSSATTCRSARRPSRSCGTGRALAVLTRHTNLATMRTPEPAGADLRGHGRRAGPDDRLGGLPDRRRADRAAARRAAGGGRGDPARRRRDGELRQPQRGLGRSTGSATSATWSAARWPRSSPTCCATSRRVDESLALVVTGRAPWRTEVDLTRRERLDARDPAGRGGAADRCDPAAARRQRAAPARARADDQGRDHPRDPPPGQEQPADGGGAAAPAGPPAARRRGRSRRSRRPYAGWARSPLVHETLSHGFDETVDFDEVDRPRAWPCRRRGGRRARRPVAAERDGLVRAAAGRGRDVAGAWSSAELVHNAVEHGLAAGGGHGAGAGRARASRTARSVLQVYVADDGQGLPDGFNPARARGGLGHADRHVAGAGPARPDHLGGRRKPRGTVVRFAARLRAGRGRTGTGAGPAVDRGSRGVGSSAGPAGPGVAALERATLVLGQCRPRHRRPGRSRCAHFRQVSTTSQRRQTALASSIWRRAGPVFPIGKNSSGSSSRQAARLRQSIRIVLLESGPWVVSVVASGQASWCPSRSCCGAW